MMVFRGGVMSLLPVIFFLAPLVAPLHSLAGFAGGSSGEVRNDKPGIIRKPAFAVMSSHSRGHGREKKSDEILVKFRPDAGKKVREALHKRHGSIPLRDFASLNLHHVKLKKGLSVADAIALYGKEPEVLYAEPNYLQRLQAQPNDPLYSNLWGMESIKAPAAWNSATGSPEVVIAVIDSGIDYRHPDLAANIWSNTGETAGNAVDDDHNGYIDDVHGINAIGNGGDPMDDHGHGTHVAGTIGATGNNAIGVAGVNWNIRMIGCRFIDSSGSGYTDGAIACLNYIRELKNAGVNIVASNNSWGSTGYSQALKDAIAAQGDILFIAAAGNDAKDNDNYGFYPAGYDLANLISVAATDQGDNKAYFSNYGKHSVHLAAPGDGIFSTLSAVNVFGAADGYGYLSGTSMAAPHLTGLAALIKAQDQGRDWRTVRNLILSGGDPVPALQEVTISGRRINASASLSCSDSPTLLVQQAPSSLPAGVPATLSVISLNCGSPAGPVTVQSARGDLIVVRDDGVLPDLAAGDGVFTGSWTPTHTGDKLSLASPAGNLALTLPPLGMTDYLPEAGTRTSYRQRLEGKGGAEPYTWEILAGSLPSGLTLDAASGEIAGDAVSNGTNWFILRMTDLFGSQIDKPLTLRTTSDVVLEQWVSFLDRANAEKLALDANGYSYLTGVYLGGQSLDLVTAKFDPAGKLVWSRSYDVAGYEDRGFGVAVDGSGNVYASGVTWGVSLVQGNWSWSRNLLVLKYDPSGNLLWAKNIDKGGDDGAWTMTLDGSGHLYTAGSTEAVFGQQSALVTKFDLSGNEIWSRTYTLRDYNVFQAISVDAAGNVFLGGGSAYTVPTEWGSTNEYDVLVVKYDSAGNLVWARTRDCGSIWEWANGIGVDPAGNVYVTAESYTGAMRSVTLKYDAAGNEIWNRVYGLDAFFAQDLALDAKANVLLTGRLFNGYNSVHTVKYDPSGNLVWGKTLDSERADEGRAIALGGDGTILVAGTHDSASAALVAAYREYDLVVAAPGPQAATAGTPFSLGLAAAGGQPPYVWSLKAGLLPPGLALSAGGSITGTPSAAGSSTFTVQASDLNLLTGSREVTVDVAPGFAASFNATPLSGTVPLYVNFTDLSTGGPLSWSWQFGDGAASSQQNPAHLYTTPGTYPVTLTTRAGTQLVAASQPSYITVLACANAPVKTGNAYYPLIEDAYTMATDSGIIKLQAMNFSSDLLLERDIRVALAGGYDCGFAESPAPTGLFGALRVSRGTVRIDRLRFR